MKQHMFARRACLALALASLAGTAMAASDTGQLCGGSSIACLEQVSQALAQRGDASPAPAPKARRAPPVAEAPARPRGPRLNLDQKLSAHPDSEPEGT